MSRGWTYEEYLAASDALRAEVVAEGIRLLELLGDDAGSVAARLRADGAALDGPGCPLRRWAEARMALPGGAVCQWAVFMPHEQACVSGKMDRFVQFGAHREAEGCEGGVSASVHFSASIGPGKGWPAFLATFKRAA